MQDLIDAKFDSGDSILECIFETEPKLKSKMQDLGLSIAVLGLASICYGDHILKKKHHY